MFKFLRKYNKWILAVGGTLLMIVFLIPQAIQGLSQSAGFARATRATVGPANEKVDGGLWSQVVAEAELIKRLEQGGPVVPQVGSIDGPAHWYLLTREADQAGLVGSPNAIPYSAEEVQNIANSTGIDPRVVQRTIAKLDGVLRLVNLYVAAGEASDHRLKRFAARAFHTVDAEVLVIPASADAVAYQPAEEELREQFEMYRDVEPGEGEMGFGYRLPDRLKLEWLAVSATSVREMIRRSDEMDTVNLRYHWSRNPDGTFPPVNPEAMEIPESVREHLLTSLTKEKLAEIEKFASDQLRANQRGIPQRQGYYQLPEDWEMRRLGLTDLAQAIQSRFGVELPAYRAIGDRWLTVDDVRALEGIGRATTDRYGTPRTLADIVAALKEFGGSLLMQVQEGIAGPTLRDRDENIYVFRVVDTDPSRPPHSVDEVRDELVRDLRRLAHYQQLAETLSVLEDAAREKGMLELAMEREAELGATQVTLCSIEALFSRIQRNESMELVPSALPVIGRHKPTVETIVEHALSLPEGVPVSELSPEQRVFGVPVQDHLSVVLVRIMKQLPLTQAFYASLVGSQTPQALLLSQELGGLQESVHDTFSFESLAARHNFTLIGGSEEDEASIELDDIIGVDSAATDT